MREAGIIGEVVVADNGSTDDSKAIAVSTVPGRSTLPNAVTVPR